jgi:hypothetical protein
MKETAEGYALFPNEFFPILAIELGSFRATDTLKAFLAAMEKIYDQLPDESSIMIEVEAPEDTTHSGFSSASPKKLESGKSESNSTSQNIPDQTKPYLNTFIRDDKGRYCLVVSWPVPLEERKANPDFDEEFNPIPYEYGRANIDTNLSLESFYNLLVATIVGNEGVAMFFDPLIHPPLPDIFQY